MQQHTCILMLHYYEACVPTMIKQVRDEVKKSFILKNVDFHLTNIVKENNTTILTYVVSELNDRARKHSINSLF